MATQVEIRSEDRDALVRLSYHPSDQHLGTLLVEVRTGGLNLDHEVFSSGGDGLPAFLAGLATDWRGWEGTRSWHTIEHGLTVEATHHGNRARLLLIVRPDPDSGWEQNDWEVRLPLLVAPGESLAHIATAARTLFAPA